MSYESFLIETPDISETLEEINKAGQRIVAVTNISNTEQLLLIVEDRERSIFQQVGRKRINQEIEGEGD